jgi:hypothetical protein
MVNGSIVAFVRYLKKGKDGVDGKDGANGIDGKDGTNGKDGANGKDGVDGKDGADGDDGRGVSQVITYYQATDSGTTAPTIPAATSEPSSAWSTSVLLPTKGKPYVWSYQRIQYTAAPLWEKTDPYVCAMYASPGAKGERGAAFRGVPEWENVATGFDFKSGGEGEEFYDVVHHNGYYWQCVVSHTKTASNYPSSNSSDSGSSYWRIYEVTDFTATRSLITDAIHMVDEDGNILFAAEGGTVECNTGKFRNVQVQGDVIIGDYDEETDTHGERVEIRPSSKAIRIFDAFNNQVNELSGQTLTASDALPGSRTSFTLTSDATVGSTGKSYTTAGTDIVNLSNALYIAERSVIRINARSLQAYVSWTGKTTASSTMVQVQFFLRAYTSASASSYVKSTSVLDTLTATSGQSAESSGSAVSGYAMGRYTSFITVEGGYYYRLVAVVYRNAGSCSSASYIGRWYIKNMTYLPDDYKNTSYAGGMVISRGADNYMAFVSEDTSLQCHMVAGGAGLKAVDGVLYTRHNGADDWAKAPQLLYHCVVKATKTSGKYSYALDSKPYTFDGSSVSDFKVVKSSDGVVSVNIPEDAPSLDYSNCVIHAIGLPGYGDTSAEKTLFVSLGSISNGRSLTFNVSDDSSLNDGSFMFDVWYFG